VTGTLTALLAILPVLLSRGGHVSILSWTLLLPAVLLTGLAASLWRRRGSSSADAGHAPCGMNRTVLATEASRPCGVRISDRGLGHIASYALATPFKPSDCNWVSAQDRDSRRPGRKRHETAGFAGKWICPQQLENPVTERISTDQFQRAKRLARMNPDLTVLG